MQVHIAASQACPCWTRSRDLAEDRCGIVGRYQEPWASGSYLLLTHFCNSCEEARAF